MKWTINEKQQIRRYFSVLLLNLFFKFLIFVSQVFSLHDFLYFVSNSKSGITSYAKDYDIFHFNAHSDSSEEHLYVSTMLGSHMSCPIE